MTKFIEQRVDELENQVAKMELIIHELRGKKSIKPSTTNTVEDIIEFEGKQYKKVDRLAREGDVVVLNDVGGSHYFETNKPYKVQRDMNINGVGKLSGHKEAHPVYVKQYNRTPESVDVYELIKEGLNPQIPIVDETIKPLTQNQQRAEIIEKAKSFVEETEKYLQQPQADRTKGNYIYQESSNIVKFVINVEKRTIVVLLYDKYLENKLNGKGIAKCDPNDVFNEHIGKAIALGRVLGLDVSEFEQAVQPTEFAVGQKVFYNSEHGESFSGIRTISGFNSANLPLSEERGGYMDHRKLTILNDTNARYEVES